MREPLRLGMNHRIACGSCMTVKYLFIDLFPSTLALASTDLGLELLLGKKCLNGLASLVSDGTLLLELDRAMVLDEGVVLPQLPDGALELLLMLPA